MNDVLIAIFSEGCMRSFGFLMVGCAASLACAAAPAVAAPIISDAFTSFNATQGAGGFTYSLDTGPSQALQYFTATSNCFIDNSICLQAAANHDVPGVTKSTEPSFQYNSVNVPTDRLLLHPSSNVNSAVDVLYRAPTAGTYIVRASYNVQDVNPTGVGVSFIDARGGGTNKTYLQTIGSAAPSGSFHRKLFFNAGDAVGFGFDNAGNYSNDSTGLNFSISAVPEPATWLMMILGFGTIGGLLRIAKRRSDAKFDQKIGRITVGVEA